MEQQNYLNTSSQSIEHHRCDRPSEATLAAATTASPPLPHLEIAKAHQVLGAVCVRQQNWEDALQHFATAISLAPTIAELHYQAGQILAQVGRRDDAIQALRQALTLNPESDVISTALHELLADTPALQHPSTATSEGQPLEPVADPSQIVPWSQRPLNDPPDTPDLAQADKLRRLIEPPPDQSVNHLPPHEAIAPHNRNHQFDQWLHQAQSSLIVSLSDSNRLGVISSYDEQTSVLLRPMSEPLALAAQRQWLAIAQPHGVTLFADTPELATQSHDALLLPRMTYFTGNLGIQELAFGDDGLWLVSAQFDCLALLHPDYSCVPRWRSPLSTELQPDQCCHFSGVALQDGDPAYVTAFAATTEPMGWQHRSNAGVIFHVETGDVVLQEQAFPNSPRWHDGALWWLNGGTGELLRLDVESRQKEVIGAFPGFVSGLAIVDGYALIGVSQRSPWNHAATSSSLPYAEQSTGIALVNLRSGQWQGWLDMPHAESVKNLIVLPSMRHPRLIEPERPAIKQAITTPEGRFWLPYQA